MNTCLTCKHYRPEPSWERAGICEWPTPPWVLGTLKLADMRCRIVGQSEGADCPVYFAADETGGKK